MHVEGLWLNLRKKQFLPQYCFLLNSKTQKISQNLAYQSIKLSKNFTNIFYLQIILFVMLISNNPYKQIIQKVFITHCQQKDKFSKFTKNSLLIYQLVYSDKMEYVNEQQAKAYEQECFYAFKDKQLHLIDKPARGQDRQCTDYCCLLTFAVIFIAFIVYSIFCLNAMFSKNLTKLNQADKVTFLSGVTQYDFERYGVVVGSCIAGSAGISIFVILLLKCIPQIMVFLMTFSVIGVIIVVAIYDFVKLNSGIGEFYAAIVAFYIYCLIVYWDSLTKAAILMKTIGNFVFQNPKILLILVFSLFYCVIILFLWVGGFYAFCVLYSHGQMSFQGFAASFAFWVFMLIFFNFYFYYTSVFLTASSLAIWFYDKTEYDLIISPFKWMVRYHLGTITFASLVITLGKLLKFFLLFARFRKSDNGILTLVGMFMGCVIYFCLGAIQAMIEIINNYAIIICGLSGFSLIDSAKILGQFIFNDTEQVFSQFSIAMYFVSTGGVLTISIIPTLVGGVLLSNLPGTLWALGIIMILFTSSMIGLIFLQIFVQGTSTLFLLYIMDAKLSKEGLDVVWIDKFAKQLQKGFDQAFVGKIQKQKIKTKNLTTVVIQNGNVQVFEHQVVEIQDYSNSNILPPQIKQ